MGGNNHEVMDKRVALNEFTQRIQEIIVDIYEDEETRTLFQDGKLKIISGVNKEGEPRCEFSESITSLLK